VTLGKRILVVAGLAGIAAGIAYFAVDLWNEQQLLRKLRESGVQTDGVVTRLDMSHPIDWGMWFWIEYDYVAGGTKYHARISSKRSPAAAVGEHIPVSYVAGEPDASLPFGQRDLALSDDPQGERDEDLMAFLIFAFMLSEPFRRWRSRRRGSPPRI